MIPAVFVLRILWGATAVTVVHSAALEDYSLTIAPDQYKGKLIFLGAYVRLEVHGKGPHTGPEARSAAGAPPVLTSSIYSMSQEEDTIAEARENCPRLTRGKGTLVKIETAEEDQKVQDFVIAHGSNIIKHPEKFWTDGVCNKYREWKWNSNGALMGEYKHFGYTAGAQSGAIMVFQSTSEVRDDYEWRMEFDRTARHRYICEEEETLPNSVPPPSNDVAVSCHGTNDLVLVLDSSWGLKGDEYKLLSEFVAKLAGAFPPPNHVAFITYSSEVKLIFGLDNHFTPNEIQDKILTQPQDQQYTFTGGGIEEATAEFGRNGRPGVSHKIIVFTDGESNMIAGSPPGNGEYVDDPTAEAYTAAAVSKAKAQGITLYTVGIISRDALNWTNGVGRGDQLLMIAGGMKDNQYGVQNTDALISKIHDISTKLCGA